VYLRTIEVVCRTLSAPSAVEVMSSSPRRLTRNVIATERRSNARAKRPTSRTRAKTSPNPRLRHTVPRKRTGNEGRISGPHAPRLTAVSSRRGKARYDLRDERAPESGAGGSSHSGRTLPDGGWGLRDLPGLYPHLGPSTAARISSLGTIVRLDRNRGRRGPLR